MEIEENENFAIQEDGIEITALVTKLNEKFDDKRMIVGIDVPDDEDIPIRDLHSKKDGYGKVVGLTSKDNISFDENGQMVVKWKTIDGKIERMIKTAKHPEKLFQYSPELGNPIKYGNKRAGKLVGIAITPEPAWSKSKTQVIHFEKLTNKDEFFEGVEIENPDNGSKKEDSNMDEVVELKLANQKLESKIETFEKEIESKDTAFKTAQEDFESQKKQITEDFEAQLKAKDDELTTKTQELEAKVEEFETLEKDNAALKADLKEKTEMFEKIESAKKMEKAEEIFELGEKLNMEGYTKENKDKKVDELFELSTEYLDFKKADYEGFAKITPAKRLPATPQGGKGVGAKAAYDKLFGR